MHYYKTKDENRVMEGILLEAPDTKVEYFTKTQRGFLDSKHHFKYKKGEEISFKANDLILGTTKAKEKINASLLEESVQDKTINALMKYKKYQKLNEKLEKSKQYLQSKGLSGVDIADISAIRERFEDGTLKANANIDEKILKEIEESLKGLNGSLTGLE